MSYYISKLKKSAEFKAASKKEQDLIVAWKKQEVIDKQVANFIIDIIVDTNCYYDCKISLYLY